MDFRAHQLTFLVNTNLLLSDKIKTKHCSALGNVLPLFDIAE